MGHIVAKQTYKRLRERLDRYPVGTPGEGTIYEILKIIYTPEEAELAARMPLKFSSLGSLSRRLDIPRDELRTKLDAMAAKGVVFDLHVKGKDRYILNPSMVGFIEFSMMRIREDIDQHKLGKLFHQYMLEEPDFANQFKEGTQTTPFRVLAHEETLPENYTEVLDWERATHIVREAGRWAVGICYCRHVAHHMGNDCKAFPMESTCLSIGGGVDYLVRHGMAKEIERSEAEDLLNRSREAGLVHLCDNLKNKPTFICNCCGCCCEVLQGFKRFRTFGHTISSNYEAAVDSTTCIGCKKCKKACPIDAVDVVEKPHMVGKKRFKRMARIDHDICLGCGVCALVCKSGAMQMAPRPRRRIAPESTFARILMMAIEQDKLHELLIDKDDGLTALAANTLLGAVLKLPPAKQLLARDALKSRFVDLLLSRLKKKPAGS
ncbi:MAG: 4Fe-4S dicluster domain-containing protein [Deltaproteobacteria bacterium]|nr:4Fe-4S dicluster domain-containing protein [Deltaproteobacteria bacterium]